MYRLLKLRSVNLQNAYRMPSVQEPPRMCLFCNHYHQHSQKSQYFIRKQTNDFVKLTCCLQKRYNLFCYNNSNR